MTAPRFSVVIPVFNEMAALGALVAEITETMQALGRGYECIIVDDGSTDGTARLVDELARREFPRIEAIHFPTNRGQGAALYTGLRRARGDIVITLDGDGQNCPADIPRLVGILMKEGADLVCGIRHDRRDSGLRQAMSRLANAVRSRFLGDGVRDSGCGLKVMRRAVVACLPPLRTLYSFIPAFAVAAGFVVTEHRVTHRARHGGRSSYGLWIFLWRPLVDMLGVRWYQRRCTLRRDDIAGASDEGTVDACPDVVDFAVDRACDA